ncbi:MAG: twin-arginine translocase TatA/TatE family subunit [Magnetococcales bacterium]|nr:twin-arginine translocase TatA/TatE family subunit [Magnetococcales bacterium]
MLGMGWIEIFVVIVVALLVIGPESLPEVARSLAKGLRQVQRIVAEVRDSINLDEFERRHPPKTTVHPEDPPLPRVTGIADSEDTITPSLPAQKTTINKSDATPMP